MLTLYDWIYGIAQLTAAFLAILAGIISLSMIRASRKYESLSAWKYLIVALVLFSVVEVLGSLTVFGVYSTPHLTHITVSVLLLFFIAALNRQIDVNKGWAK